MRALLLHLTGLVEPARTDVLTAGALALVKDGRAVLVPPGARADLKRNETVLNRSGVAVDDHHHAAVDVQTGELVVEPPAVDLPPEAWSALGELYPEPARGELVVPAGRYPVAGWVFLDQTLPELTPADGVLRALSLLRHAHEVGVQGAVDALAGVFATARPLAVENWSGRMLVEAVDRCLAT